MAKLAANEVADSEVAGRHGMIGRSAAMLNLYRTRKPVASMRRS
jgi:hypothetical protein